MLARYVKFLNDKTDKLYDSISSLTRSIADLRSEFNRFQDLYNKDIKDRNKIIMDIKYMLIVINKIDNAFFKNINGTMLEGVVDVLVRKDDKETNNNE